MDVEELAGELRRGVDDVFAVVEEHVVHIVAELAGQVIERRPTGGPGHPLAQAGSVEGGKQRSEHGPIDVGENLLGQPRLADTTGTRDRDQPSLAQRGANLVELRVTSDQHGPILAPAWHDLQPELPAAASVSAMEQTIFEAMGGAPALQSLAEAWHARCMADPILAHAFEGGIHPAHTERLAAYWAEQLGGPATYTASVADYPHVVRLHAGNGPHEQMDGRAVASFVFALDDGRDPDRAESAVPAHRLVHLGDRDAQPPVGGTRRRADRAPAADLGLGRDRRLVVAGDRARARGIVRRRCGPVPDRLGPTVCRAPGHRGRSSLAGGASRTAGRRVAAGTGRMQPCPDTTRADDHRCGGWVRPAWRRSRVHGGEAMLVG